MRVQRGHHPRNQGFSDPAHPIWRVAEISLAVKPVIVVGVADPNMQWGRFVCPSCSQKNTAQSYKALGDFRVPLNKLVEVVLHVGKGAKFGEETVNGGQNICSRDTSVGNGKLSPQLTTLYIIFWLVLVCVVTVWIFPFSACPCF